MNSKPELRLDWATASAARYACAHWHYSGTAPPGVAVIVGVWEGGKFIGVVMFARGASKALGRPYGLEQTECIELVRIALREHCAPVSRIMRIAVQLLKQHSPGLRLLVSFADTNHGHHGGIYQAAGWLYTGRTAESPQWRDKDGRVWHAREVTATGFVRQFHRLTRCPKRSECTQIRLPGKHRYLLPLDAETRERLAPLARPYPKRVAVASADLYNGKCVGSAATGTPAIQAGGGGEEPTSALQTPAKAKRRG